MGVATFSRGSVQLDLEHRAEVTEKTLEPVQRQHRTRRPAEVQHAGERYEVEGEGGQQVQHDVRGSAGLV